MIYTEPFLISTKVFNDDRGDFSPLVFKDILPNFKVAVVHDPLCKCNEKERL